MDTTNTIGFMGIAFALQAFGFTIIKEDFTKGAILVGAALLVIGISAILNKNGIVVGSTKVGSVKKTK